MLFPNAEDVGNTAACALTYVDEVKHLDERAVTRVGNSATLCSLHIDTETAREYGALIGRECAGNGIQAILGPSFNLMRTPLNGRNFEYYGEDPVLAGETAAGFIRGCQSERVAACPKHLALNNQEICRTTGDSIIDERSLQELYLRSFEIAVRTAAPWMMMSSYNKINGVYAPNCHDICTKALRNEWGFDGVVMTDWFSTNKGQANNALAMQAGNDLIMPGGGSYKKEILKGLKSGLITEEDLRRCCGNVVKAILDSAIQKEYIG